MKHAIMSLSAVLAIAALSAPRAPLAPGAQPPKPWLVINEDNDRYFKRANLPGNVEETNAEACERYLDMVVDGGRVTHFFMCVCGQRTSYDSKVWEPIWKGLEGVERDGSPATNNSWCINAKKMHDAGVDPYAIWTRRCREKGVSPWITMRMNDVHFCSVKNYFRTESFWTDHPELHLVSPDKKPSWNDHAFDYVHPEVRAHALALVDEIFDRWDTDGLELDWLRFPNNLTLGRAEELSYVLTDFMREVRRRADAAAKRRGHPVRIAARVPTVYAVARHLGFDPETWAKDGLVDIITVCNAYSASDFDIDVADWQARIRRVNPSVTLLPGTDIPIACMPVGDADKMMVDDGNMAARRGWCAANANPDGFYFFNVPYLDAAARCEMYTQSLQPDRLDTLPRRFIVSFHDIAAKGKCRARQIPVKLDRPRTLFTRAAPGAHDEFAYVIAGFDNAKAAPPASATLNGAASLGEPERLFNVRKYSPRSKCAYRWKFPAASLRKGENAIGFAAAPGGKTQVVWCEIALGAPGAESHDRDFVRMPYNNPGATSYLGVGLWAWPMAMDFDGDGDLDLVVSCPDTPHNGTYLFENATPKGERNARPVFRKARRLGSGFGNTVLTAYRGRPVVTRPGHVVWNPKKDIAEKGERVNGLLPNVHPNRVRGNTWRFVDWNGNGHEDLLIGVGDWTEYGWANAYDANGKWTNGPLRGRVYVCRHEKGEGPDAEYAKAEPVLLADGTPLEVYGNPMPMAEDWDGDGDLDMICGSFMDDFTWFENVGTRAEPRFAAGRKVLAANGKKLAMDLQMITPSAVDWDGDGKLDVICGDEDGRVAFIRNTGRVENGMPVFEQPYYFRQEADCVKFGALATPYACDWDGDGDWDMISGSSAGYIAFIENLSGLGVAQPRWAEPKLLTACGTTIRIQAGENGSIQGPCEAKWGYTVLSVADWDGDGYLDIVCNSIFGDVIWFRNPGGSRSCATENADGKKVVLDMEPPRPVEVEWNGAQPELAWGWRKPKGKALLTQWRTSPVAIDWNKDGLVDLVMLDQKGYLCLFQRARAADGRLVLQSPRRVFADGKGNLYRFSNKTAGGSGRRKICFVDWDCDGKLDIAVNDRNAFLYKQIGLQPDGVWRFRNAWLMGERRLQGHSSCPTWTDFDGDGLPELLVGAEDGFFYTLANPLTETRK